jgi:hypothetical protein
MTQTATVKLTDFVIPNGTSISNILPARSSYEDAQLILLTGENVADGAITYTLEVTDDPEPSVASAWFTLQDTGGDFVPPLQGKAKAAPLAALSATGLRIKSSANVTASRTFGASKQYFM